MSRLTQEDFIRKARAVHGDKYDYSRVQYVNCKTKVEIVCPKHGVFLQTPDHHMRGRGCPKCRNEFISRKNTLTTEDFIKKAIEVHGDRYNYDEVVYVNNRTKVVIVCPEHGEFLQVPSHHLLGSGCPICAKQRAARKLSLSTDEFIVKARAVHGDKYDYGKMVYRNNSTKIEIKCNQCGIYFWQIPYVHLSGCGCTECGKKEIGRKRLLGYETFLKRAKAAHGDKYDYSCVTYVDCKTPIKIICPKHGVFSQTPEHHMGGCGCPKCGDEVASIKNTHTIEDFIKKAIAVHGDRYNYDKAEYVSCRNPICITCPEHGDFWQVPYSHLSGRGCPVCRRSRLEEAVMIELDERGIDYVYQYRNPFLGQQSLDFYIEDIKVGIEAQGVQHYRPVSFGGNESADVLFERVRENDRKKKVLCEKNNVKLFYFTLENGVAPTQETYTDLNLLMETIEGMMSGEDFVFQADVTRNL